MLQAIVAIGNTGAIVLQQTPTRLLYRMPQNSILLLEPDAISSDAGRGTDNDI